MKIIWSEKEDAQLKEMRKKGMTFRQIGEALGRPKTTIAGRLEKIRESPLQKKRKAELISCKCMKCRKPFGSWDTTLNRICGSCKETDAWKMGSLH